VKRSGEVRNGEYNTITFHSLKQGENIILVSTVSTVLSEGGLDIGEASAARLSRLPHSKYFHEKLRVVREVHDGANVTRRVRLDLHISLLLDTHRWDKNVPIGSLL
jgi:hypothetical protein